MPDSFAFMRPLRDDDHEERYPDPGDETISGCNECHEEFYANSLEYDEFTEQYLCEECLKRLNGDNDQDMED